MKCKICTIKKTGAKAGRVLGEMRQIQSAHDAFLPKGDTVADETGSGPFSRYFVVTDAD